jgi:WD40 repeat protein
LGWREMLVWSFAFGIMAQAKSPPVDGQFGLTDRLLRAGYRPCAGADDRISRADSDFLVAQIQEFEPKFDQPRVVAKAAVEQYELLNHKPPGLALSAVFLLAQLGIILLGAVGASALELKNFARDVELASTACYSSDGTRIATTSWDGTARVWDAGSGEELASLEGHEMGVWGVTFSPDGTRIATVSFDETARVWDAATGQELSVLKGHQSLVSEVAFSPDGTRIATESTLDRTVRVWDAATGEELVVLKGQRLHMNTPFSPDSTRIATGSPSVLERTVRVWDATTGEELAVLDWHEEIVSGYDFCSGVVFSPDGTHVTALSNRGVVRTFDVADGRLVSEIRLRRPIGRLIDHLLLQLRRYVARDRQALESAPSE